MAERPRLTVLVPTFNEEANLPDCLDSVRWADQIVIVDSYSSDGTLAVARQYTEHIFQHEYVNSATQKNWALDTLPLAGDWVLIVDADERITPELAAEIRAVIQANADQCAGYFINRREFCFGRWIRHAGMWPSWNLRLFRRGSARYEAKEVDADVALRGGAVGFLKCPMDHLKFPTISSYLKMLDRYSTWDALEAAKRVRDESAVPADSRLSQALKRWAKGCFAVLPGKWLLLFVYLYFGRWGVLDGRAGFTLCALLALRQFLAEAKRSEMRRDPTRAERLRREATRGKPA
jgi:glycosyltransferase involved in cell wall biosynthesis